MSCDLKDQIQGHKVIAQQAESGNLKQKWQLLGQFPLKWHQICCNPPNGCEDTAILIMTSITFFAKTPIFQGAYPHNYSSNFKKIENLGSFFIIVTSKPNFMQIGDGRVENQKNLGDLKWNDPPTS